MQKTERLEEEAKVVASVHFTPLAIVCRIAPLELPIRTTLEVNIDIACGGLVVDDEVVLPDVNTDKLVHVVPALIVLATKFAAPYRKISLLLVIDTA